VAGCEARFGGPLRATKPSASLSLIAVEDLLELASNGWNVAFDDVADDVLIDMEVGVHEDHSSADDLAPRDLGVGGPELIREM